MSLGGIVAYVSAEYGVSKEELRKGASRNRMVSEAHAVIGWLSRQLRVCSIKGVAIYFQSESSTFSQDIGKMDTKAKSSDRLRDKLDAYINACLILPRFFHIFSRISCVSFLA